MIASFNLPELALFALFGLVFGSFASAVSYRLPRGEPVAVDRSRCPVCKTALSARDLVPLLSWLVSRARCRHCQAPIPWRYPLMEFALAVLFVAAGRLAHADLMMAVCLAATFLGLLVIIVTDLEAGIIPNVVLLALVPVALAYRSCLGWSLTEGALGAVFGFALPWLARAGFRRLTGRDGLGFGDVKFAALAGLYLGPGGIGPFLVVAGGLGLVMGLLWRLSGRGEVFPLGPALCVALLIAVAFPEWLSLGYPE
ncbi:MAG TPA: prepilin peptidase [Rhodospirillaceae bacterium]|nr:prepilin peptidase [Rhodospirillaceae bacterium]